MPAFSTASSGTDSSAPAIPAASRPAVIASTTASGCNRTARPSSHGCSTWLSSCITPITIASTTSAEMNPLATNAISTATVPATTAPMIGTNADRNTSADSGITSGTCTIARPMPMPTASTSATAAVART